MKLRELKEAWNDLRDALGMGDPVLRAATAEPAGPKEPARSLAGDTEAETPADRVASVAESPAEATPARRFLPGRRYWIVLAVLVALLVTVLQWAPWRLKEPADPSVIATFAGGAVTREQLLQQFEALPEQAKTLYRSVDGLRTLAGDIVVHEVIRRWGEEKQVDQKELFKEAMKHATEEIQIADVSDQLHQGRIQVGEAEIQAYYDQNRQQFGERPLVEVKEQIRPIIVEQKEQEYVKGYLKDLKERASLQVDYGLLDVPEPSEQELLNYYQANRARFLVPEQARVAQIQMSVSLVGSDEEARARAETLRAQAAAGADFSQLAREQSDSPEKAQGGVIANPVPRGSRGKAFDEAVFSLKPGDISPAFKDGDSYYVVKLLENQPEKRRSFQEARSEIAGTLRTEREQQVYAERKDRTLFTIHSRRTTLGEFLQEMQEIPAATRTQYAGTEGKRRLLDALIERLLVVEDASEQASDVKRQGDIQQVQADLLAQFLHQEEVDEKLKVSDEEVQAEYERNKTRYADPPKVKVRYIRVSRGTSAGEDQAARARIEEAAAKLRPQGLFGRGGPPADFGEVARQYSEDPETAAKGGELDRWFGESEDAVGEIFEHALHEAILPLKVGEISPVLTLGDSYYLFQVREKQEARPRAFEEAKDIVRKDLEARKHEDLTRNMERDLLKRMQLQVYDRRIQGLVAELGGSTGRAQ